MRANNIIENKSRRRKIHDKKHQLSDWRQRPIPMELRMNAVADTMYLLDIYDKLKIKLHQTTSLPNQDILIKTVLDQSKEICSLRFDKGPFEPNDYKSIMVEEDLRQTNYSNKEKVY